jgi:hypothetical protein
MHGLRELQLGFSRDVFSGGGTGFGDRLKDHGLSADRRLQIYRNNSYTGFTNTLRTTYPVVERLVGEGFFRYAAHHYITCYPSTAGDLHEFGALFPEFLQTFEAAAELVYLPDVARLEWAYEKVYYAAGRALLNPQALAVVPPECYGELRFTLNSASQLLASDYPILRIWQVNQADYEGDQTVDLDTGGSKLLLLRNSALDVEIQPLAEGEFALLQALAEGCNCTGACEQALAVQADFDVPASFQRHLLQGTLVDFSL